MTDAAEAIATAETPQAEESGWEWEIVEIFGHRRHAGRAREEERFGAKMLRIDVPIKGDPDANGWQTHWYGGSSVFSYQLTDEKTVIRLNKPYEAPSPLRLEYDEGDDAVDEDDDGMPLRSIIILDHHKTAEEDLVGISRFHADASRVHLSLTDEPGLRGKCRAWFDMEHSGAALTWRFCFPGEETPRLVNYIEDRDLWRFHYSATRSISLLLRSYPYDLAKWNKLAAAMEHPPSLARLLNDAEAIERFYDQKIAEIVPTATLRSIGKWSGVPVAHAPYAFASDLAHELLKKHMEAPFSAVVVDAYGGRAYSLRSDDSRQDVSEVARMFGGGGHRNAAGFRVPL